MRSLHHTVRRSRSAIRIVAAMTAIGSVAALSLISASAPAAAATPATSVAAASSVTAAAARSWPVVSVAVSIPVRDGVVLSGTVAQPDAPGDWPIVIMPGTFAGDSININIIAAKLAARGYITVTYLERGFGKSTGEIDAGGPKDVDDVSDALTWALVRTPADASRAGVASISYGAGFAPIVALKDPRFKAIAMVSGWGDMWKARYPNHTSAWASNTALWALSTFAGRLSPEVNDFFANAVANKYTAKMKRLAQLRSPSYYLPQMRQRPMPPMYASTSMNELIWPTDQTIDFVDAYPGKKHLDILPGDHVGTEVVTPLGIPGVTWLSAFDWMDTYVAGTSTVGSSLPPIRVAPRSPTGTNAIDSQLMSVWNFENYTTIATRATQRQYLSTASSAFGLVTTTTLSAYPGTGGKSIREGDNLLLQNGIPMIQGDFEVITGAPTTVPLSLVDQGVTGLWTGPVLTAPLQLRGATRVHLDLTPSAAKGSVFVYLLEQAPDGTTYVVGHKPYSWDGATPRVATPTDVTIPYNAYDVPAGHKLIMAVSTGDVLYTDNNPAFSSVGIGPGSYVDLPLK